MILISSEIHVCKLAISYQYIWDFTLNTLNVIHPTSYICNYGIRHRHWDTKLLTYVSYSVIKWLLNLEVEAFHCMCRNNISNKICRRLQTFTTEQQNFFICEGLRKNLPLYWTSQVITLQKIRSADTFWTRTQKTYY